MHDYVYSGGDFLALIVHTEILEDGSYQTKGSVRLTDPNAMSYGDLRLIPTTKHFNNFGDLDRYYAAKALMLQGASQLIGDVTNRQSATYEGILHSDWTDILQCG